MLRLFRPNKRKEVCIFIRCSLLMDDYSVIMMMLIVMSR